MTQTFAGYDQHDVAAVQIGGVYYRVHTYRVARYIGAGVIGGVQVRARCFVEQPNAQQVELFDEVVADTEGDLGVTIDCPKCIIVGTTVVVCWLQIEAAACTLHMASMDLSLMGTFGPAFTDQGSTTTHDSGLYDLVNIETDTYFDTHATEYVVVHRTDVDEYQIRRHDGFDWVSTAWINAYTTPADIADSILAAHAFESLVQPSFLVTYQTDPGGDDDGGVVRTTRFTSTNGVQTHDTASFAAIPALVRATQATHRRVSLNRVVLGIEYADVADFAAEDYYVRWIAGVVLSAEDTSQQSAEMACANMHLISRAFGLPGMSDIASPSQRVFIGAAWKNMGATWTYEGDATVYETGTEWGQALGFVLDLDWQRWDEDLTTRPYVVAQMPSTVFDARVGGRGGPLSAAFGASTVDGRRANHLSHVCAPPDFGPSIKSMTFAHGAFGRVQNVGISTGADAATDSKLFPVAALGRAWEFDYEDPWITWRDDRSEPSMNWRGIHDLAQHQALNVGRSLILGGSTPVIYDGIQVVELGFPYAPEIVTATGTLEGGAGGLSEGDYTYVAFFEWPDNFGAVHRSPPSLPVTITLGDPGPDGNRVVLRIRTMTVSLRDAMAVYPDAHSIHIVVYRTEANGAQLYRLHCLDNAFQSTWSIDHTPTNDPTDWAITVLDQLPDATLLAVSDPIPWPLLGAALDSGGFPIPLEPGLVPAASVMAVWQERLWLASMERPDELRYSLSLKRSNIDYQLAPEFNDVNVVRRDNMGPVTGLAAQGNQLVVLTPAAIYSVQGRPQNDTASDGDLQVYLLAEGVGCICPRSVAVTASDGVFFQSRKGYYQLVGGTPNFIGADVEDYINDAGMVLSTAVEESSHQVRLVVNTAAGEPAVLIYDYLAKLWSRALPPAFTDGTDEQHAAHGVMWRGLDGEVSHVLLQQGGAGFERASTDTPYGDQDETGDNIAIPINVQTSWIHVADIANVQRIRSILLTLDRPTASAITVTLEYSIDGGYQVDLTQTITFASGTAVPLRCRPSVQKCTAFRIRIRETGSVPTTEGLRITAITLIAGVKRGHSQVPAAQIG
jgi:hypothetical protein